MNDRWPAELCWSRRVPRERRATGLLQPFARPIGLDVIVTDGGEAVLVELQHGFGRRGLIELFPEADRWYRRRLRQLKRRRGPCPELRAGIRRLCSDKVATYRSFARYQPPSFVYLRWGPKVERWLDDLDAELVIAKPPRGSNGRGIRVFEREELRRRGPTSAAPRPALLQAFVPSRHLVDAAGLPHVGCIRHVVVMDSDGVGVELIHMPSYWRVAPSPLAAAGLAAPPSREALTANIARGAYPVRLTTADSRAVHGLAEQVCPELVARALDLDVVPPWTSTLVPSRGGEPLPTQRGPRPGGEPAPPRDAAPS